MSQENPWADRHFIEPAELDRFPNRRRYLCLEDTTISLAEDGTSFYVIVDESGLGHVRNKEGRPMFGISVAAFATDVERSDYLRQKLW